MQVLVLYYSKGGNTRRLAEEIAKGVSSTGIAPVLKTSREVTKDDFLASAGIIAGSPVYFGVMAADLKRVFDEFVGSATGHPAFISTFFGAGLASGDYRSYSGNMNDIVDLIPNAPTVINGNRYGVYNGC